MEGGGRGEGKGGDGRESMERECRWRGWKEGKGGGRRGGWKGRVVEGEGGGGE